MTEARGAFAAFRVVAFRRYQLARLASVLSTQMASVAIGWQVYATTHRARDLGYIGLAQFLPAMGLALVSGAVADRFDRRRVVVACHALVALGWATLFLLTRQGIGSVAPVQQKPASLCPVAKSPGAAAAARDQNGVLPAIVWNAARDGLDCCPRSAGMPPAISVEWRSM